MSDEPLEQVERQIASVLEIGVPAELRGVVLGDVHRELRAARWDRRLARMAVLLFVVAVGMNAVIGLRGDGSRGRRLDGDGPAFARSSLVDTAIVAAESNDTATAHQIARQLAAMMGRKLTSDEAAAIDAAMQRQTPRGATGNKG